MKKILVCIKDTSEYSRRILRTAASISKAERSPLYILYVFEVPMSLPLDEEVPEELDRGDRILDWAIESSEEFSINAETHIIQARTAGSGILNEIRDINSDIVILGMKHDPGPGEHFIGQTAEYILKSAPCDVILVRPGNNNV